MLLISTAYLAKIVRENGGMGKKGRAASPLRLLVKLRVESKAYFNSLWAVVFLVSLLGYYLHCIASKGKGQ